MEDEINTLIKEIKEMVLDIRIELASKFDTTVDGKYHNFSGLCDTASTLFKQYFKSYCEKNNIDATVKCVHGEQRHSPICPRKYWPYQHTWNVITYKKYRIYVDCTSSQFKSIYDDIPDFYVSISRPKWYFPDKYNINWRYDWKHPVITRIIEFIQYEIWGRICDVFHAMIYK